MNRWSAAIRVNGSDVERISDRLFLARGDRWRNHTAFWVLLTLSAVIAAAGVVAQSTATVIGAMIVAPLMTPILGTALAIVLADRHAVARSIALTVGASAAVVAIGYLVGLTIQLDVVADTNSEVAARVSPKLIDLVAAIATGLVGAFAVVRSDVSDTLPGVAIAISLVPPLAVVGLTAESGAYDQSMGALLLFGTNVAAIIATGTAVLLAARVRASAPLVGIRVDRLRGRSLVTVAASLLLVAAPLAGGSLSVAREQAAIARAEPVASAWAEERGWEVTDVYLRGGTLHVVTLGLRPQSSELGVQELRGRLDEAGLDGLDVELTLVVGGSETATAEDEGGSGAGEVTGAGSPAG
ncbi:DUF389 domain-containing protein [Nocardioides sambongensis]|uniref:DUF389 domain-containing protein n=1 Tax=Nocardioides sambongensis TaxID=2589074 RepID=UPI001129532C|nr:DUF389 domain-containing protein [Nocardioides sambongensis]